MDDFDRSAGYKVNQFWIIFNGWVLRYDGLISRALTQMEYIGDHFGDLNLCATVSFGLTEQKAVE